MLFAVISDVVWQAAIAGVVTLVLAWLQNRTRNSVEKAAGVAEGAVSMAAGKAEEVKQELIITNATTAKKADEVKKALIQTEAVASAKIEEVKQSLADTTAIADEKLTELTKITLSNQKQGEEIHTLVNSNMGVQLKISCVALKRIAQLTKDADDIAAADLAKKSLEEHDAKQAKVDAGQVIKATPA